MCQKKRINIHRNSLLCITVACTPTFPTVLLAKIVDAIVKFGFIFLSARHFIEI